MLGRCSKVIITKDDTIVVAGNDHKAAIDQRIEQIKGQIEQTKSTYDKEKLEERLAKLRGGIGVVKVGGGSSIEVGEVKDRIQDALCSTRAATE